MTKGILLSGRRAVLAATLVVGATFLGIPGVAPVPGTSAQTASGCQTFVPCSDKKGCPDLAVDSSQMSPFLQRQSFSPTDCAVVENEVQPGNRLLLRFDSITPNFGPGALIIGNPLDHPDWFIFQTCHGHVHFKDYADYRLWTSQGYQQWLALRQANPGVCSRDLLSANPTVAAQMVQGHKQGFCVVDVFPSSLGPCLKGPTNKQVFTSCSDMGLSVCWNDDYPFFLDGQWIDVTGVPPGDYVLEEEVNAGRFFQEADYSNNSGSVPFTLP